MLIKFRLILLFSSLPFFLIGQMPPDEKIKTLNEYADFANECIHGMLIAHRLFENYNQDINKYVNLPGHQLNFYNNQDLPQDLFEDPDNWFYEISPEDLFKNTLDNDQYLESDLLAVLKKNSEQIRSTTFNSNRLRLSIGEAINTRDLSVPDSLYTIYELLEEAVDAYDLLSAQIIILGTELQKQSDNNFLQSKEQAFKDLGKELIEANKCSNLLLLAIKTDQKEVVAKQSKKLKENLKFLKAYSIRQSGGFASSAYIRARNRIISNIESIISSSQDYLSGVEIPEEYALYGSSYYYYNTKIINKVNRYGNGLVQAINQVFDLLNLPLVKRLESPHFLTIIYPDKVEKQLQVIKSTLDEIFAAPETLEDRTIVMSDKKHTIFVDGAEPTLEIFDHLKQDGDIISLNFNGDWIFENLSLERKPRKFILKLNKSGKNYLILHAVNEGSVPPNTIGINYVENGRRKRHIMQSNLRTSQMVEVKMSGE